jgi:hypothetical protein
MELRYIILCQTSSIDTRTNSLSAFNVIDDLNLTSFPVFFPQLSLVVAFVKEPNEPNICQINLVVSIDDQQLSNVALQLNFQGRNHLRLDTTMQAFAIPRPGLVSFSVNFDGRNLGTWKVNAVLVGTQGGVLNAPQAAPRPVIIPGAPRPPDA